MRQVLAALAMLAGTASAISGQPTISFEKDRVIAKGMTPGGQVAWFGLAWEQAAWAKLHRPYTVLAVAGKDGSAAFQLDHAVPPISVWSAADLESGQVTTATPEGFPLRRMPSPKPAVDSGSPRSVPLSADRRGMLWAALTRPRVGAWYVRAGDGGPADEDRAADGRIALLTESMLPIGAAGSPPDRMRPGDVLVVIDGETLEVYSDIVTGR